MKPRHITKKDASQLMSLLGESLEYYSRIEDKDSFCNPCSFVNSYVVRRVNQNLQNKAEAEVCAIEFAKKHTAIPVPNIIFWDKNHIVYHKIEGENLGKIWSDLSKKDQRRYMQQAISFVEQMQTFSFNKIGSFFQNGLGLVVNTQKGPFTNFSDFILSEYDKNVKDITLPIKKTFIDFRKNIRNYEPKMRFVFTHGDITPKNLLVKNGRIVGVIDWEWSGSFPAIHDLEELSWCDDELLEKSSIRQHYPLKVKDTFDMLSHSMRLAYYKEWNITDKKAFVNDVVTEVNKIIKKY